MPKTKKKTKKHDIDNDPMFDDSDAAISNSINKQLILFFDRVDRLEEEKKGIADDIKDVWAEAKANGYDTKIARHVHKLRKMQPNDRAEMEALIDTYKVAIGLD